MIACPRLENAIVDGKLQKLWQSSAAASIVA
jgi:hypothetical protein